MRCVLDSVAHSKITIGRKIRTARAANVVVNMFLGNRAGCGVFRFPHTIQDHSRNRETKAKEILKLRCNVTRTASVGLNPNVGLCSITQGTGHTLSRATGHGRRALFALISAGVLRCDPKRLPSMRRRF